MTVSRASEVKGLAKRHDWACSRHVIESVAEANKSDTILKFKQKSTYIYCNTHVLAPNFF